MVTNIEKRIELGKEKPAILPIKKTDKLNIIAIGLLQNQVLSNHKANIPTTLVVLQGAIEFRIGTEILKLEALDTYEVPVDIEHEVVGLQYRNIFTLTQEK